MNQVVAARGVLERTLGQAADKFDLHLEDGSSGADAFKVEATRGQVTVWGNSAVAICRGVYRYLKSACHRQLSWSNPRLDLPDKLPSMGLTEGRSATQFRQYLSVCTFGYSTVWWDWPRWEQEIDWMAMHGINLPLAMVGQELIWLRAFAKIGIPEAVSCKYFGGPAHLPWRRLGNLEGEGGSLPLSWMKRQAELQTRILARYRELGMNPVVPGFSGFVPREISKFVPTAEVQSAEPWAGFEPTVYLDPRSDLFRELGSIYYREYAQEFGESEFLLCETFAEQKPRLEPGSEIEDLTEIGAATWNLLKSQNANAHWVIQGWPFYFAPDFWSSDRVDALFQSVPEGRLIVLDQATELKESWIDQPTLVSKGWIHGVVHNFGQSTRLEGDIQGMWDRHWRTRTGNVGRLLGYGIAPEGIDQNPIAYEMLADLTWMPECISIGKWVRTYVAERYESTSQEAQLAWTILTDSVYSPNDRLGFGYTWRFRPGDQPLTPYSDPGSSMRATMHLLRCQELAVHSAFQRDLVDVTKTWLSGVADGLLNQALETPSDTILQERSFQILFDIDRLLSIQPEHRLQTWLSQAKACATSPQEEIEFQQEALSQITHWGGPYLFDYAIKEWSGLIASFHIPRWKLYFEQLNKGERSPNFATWEREWSNQIPKLQQPTQISALELVQELFDKYKTVSVPDQEPAQTYRFEPVSGLQTEPNSLRLEVKVPSKSVLASIAISPIFGQGIKANYRVECLVDELWVLIENPLEGPVCRCSRRNGVPPDTAAIRFQIDIESGNPGQLFQVCLGLN